MHWAVPAWIVPCAKGLAKRLRGTFVRGRKRLQRALVLVLCVDLVVYVV